MNALKIKLEEMRGREQRWSIEKQQKQREIEDLKHLLQRANERPGRFEENIRIQGLLSSSNQKEEKTYFAASADQERGENIKIKFSPLLEQERGNNEYSKIHVVERSNADSFQKEQNRMNIRMRDYEKDVSRGKQKTFNLHDNFRKYAR